MTCRVWNAAPARFRCQMSACRLVCRSWVNPQGPECVLTQTSHISSMKLLTLWNIETLLRSYKALNGLAPFYLKDLSVPRDFSYIHEENFYSVNMQHVCCSTSTVARWPGGTHAGTQARVWRSVSVQNRCLLNATNVIVGEPPPVADVFFVCSWSPVSYLNRLWVSFMTRLKMCV